MPVTSSQVDALKRFIGQGEIYINVGKPATSFAPIIFGSAGNALIPQKVGGSTNADSMGITSGPATLEYKPEFAGVEVEQAYGEVAPRVKKEAVTLKFKCAESTYDRIKAALQTGTLAQQNQSAGNANPVGVPVGTAAAGGTLTAGTYWIAYAWRRTTGIGAAVGGETVGLVSAGTALSAGNLTLAFTNLSGGQLPPGGYSVNWYVSIAPSATYDPAAMRFYVNNAGTGTANISAPATLTGLDTAATSYKRVPTANYTGNPGYDMLKVGGLTFLPSTCVTLVSDLGTFNNAGGVGPQRIWEWLTLYEALSVDGLTLSWKRGETRMVDVTMTGYADVTREEGDQLFQFGQLEDPTPNS